MLDAGGERGNSWWIAKFVASVLVLLGASRSINFSALIWR
jgi:hypothetical protein